MGFVMRPCRTTRPERFESPPLESLNDGGGSAGHYMTPGSNGKRRETGPSKRTRLRYGHFAIEVGRVCCFTRDLKSCSQIAFQTHFGIES